MNVRASAVLGVLLVGMASSPAVALDIAPTGDAQALVDAILGKGGIVVKSVTYTGGGQASGTYSAGPLGIADGAILTSGAAVNALPPNNSGSKGTDLSLPGDPLCTQLAGGIDTYDAAKLEIVFTVLPGADGISFDFIVGSEEYPEYVGQVNDVAGIFIDGLNKALDKEGNDITINGPFFSGGSVVTDSATQYDGSTPRLQPKIPLAPGDHTMVIVVCDALDGIYDTGIFVADLSACKGDCNQTAWCGDGKQDAGEDCDDGNNKDGDGCDNTCKLEAVCGDSLCFVDETCADCPGDCGECPAECGDGKCNGQETCSDCPGDCGVCPPECGDGQCNGEETCANCADDCGACPPSCGDGECNGDETCVDCPADCDVCPVSCGDGKCDQDETCENCSADCGACPPECGDGECNGEETCANCADDCGACPPSCGDGECNGDETCKDCPGDCGECAPPTCGDNMCNGEENCESCPQDCGDCPDGYGSCDACPESCEAEVDYSGVKVSGGPGGCSASPNGTSSTGSGALLLLALASLALLFVRRRAVRVGATFFSLLAASVLLAGPAQALEITTTNDAQGLAQAFLGGGGIEIKSATFTGHAEAAGTYTAGPLGIGDGSILTSGAAQYALPPNDDTGITGSWGLPGDPLCDQLAGDVATGDAAKLEIVFTVKEGFDGVRFDYIVGSEEYPEFVGEFNDTVGIFLDGVNKALDAEGNAITINGPFFSGNEVVTDSGTEYDGSTPRLQQQVKLSAGEHTLIVVVCDALDTELDTGVFVSALAGCKGNCDTTSWCGDGNVDEGEDCDDGNNVDGDGCDNTCKLEAVCGDGKCYVDETCDGCPADCGECEPECGDGICNGDETCESCEADCNCEAVCGDTMCNGDETCSSCPGDCGECVPECGDGICNGDETCESCSGDCGECEPECGDGTCNGDETCESCAGDCGECEPECGDGTCNGDETCESCEADCGECPLPEPCGDGVCKDGEDCLSCSKDCGQCPPKCETCDPECEEEDDGIEVSGGVSSCSASPVTASSVPSSGLFLLGMLALAALALRRRFFRSGLLVALFVAAAALTLAPKAALAQQDVQIESQFFKPSPFIYDYFTVGTGDIMGECRWNVGLMLNYQNDPLVLRTTDGDELGALVEHQATGDILAAIKILDWLGVGIDIPVILAQFGDDVTGFPSAGVAGLGDIRLVPRARLYQTGDGLFTLGAEVIVSFPTGKLIDPYMGRNGFGILPRLLASLDFGRAGLALNAGALVATGEDKALNVDTGHAIDTRLGGWVGLVPDKFDLIAELGTQMKLTEPMKNMDENPMEALGGLRWQAIPGLFVSAGAGAGITEGAAAPDFRVFAGIQYASCCKTEEPPPKPFCDADPDGDKLCSPCVFEQNREEEFASVCKGKDECPAEPEDFDSFEDSDGCPEPDNDKDGICDPWVPEKGHADKYKDLCRLSDSCPDVPEDADGFEDDDGCPDPDNDKDKICDPWIEEKGQTEKYKDVCKPNDQCPNEPETVNSYQDEDGCPDKAVVIEKKKIIILQRVEFYFDESRIKEESFPLLDEVVKTLQENPQVKKVSIEGHTDERGDAKYNQTLSAGRVETVLKYLSEHGIESKRLTSKGFGESKPLIKGASTEEDHQRNRRVEFIILEMEE